MSLWGRFACGERGNFVILFSVALGLASIISAIVVDAASLYHERRALQRDVDLAAIEAAQDSSNSLTLAHASLVEAGLIETGTTLAALAVQIGGNPLVVERGIIAPILTSPPRPASNLASPSSLLCACTMSIPGSSISPVPGARFPPSALRPSPL